MKISYNWLKQFIDIDWSAEKTGELLTDLGLEVESISQYESVKGGLQGIIVGYVLTCQKHPNADKLNLTTVDIGGDTPLKIVCGAPNIAVGQKVPVATVGTTLYLPSGESFIIKKAKIRGEESCGMICSEDELGIGTAHDGIMILNDNLKPGALLADVFKVETDYIFEIGLTPNRADAMSHFGVARDLKAGLLQQQKSLPLNTPSVSAFYVDNRTLKIDVDVSNKDLAPRYCGITISNITVAESPNWLKNYLKAIGITPKNNIVDITNYVLHELGQPLHAFDADKIYDRKIVVKTLNKDTKFKTLDGIERSLHEDDLMICDAEKPLCIAGVLGGINSGVTENTKSIFLESAYFNPVSIRKTAKRHGINTDASFRFERGIDPNIAEYALKRAAVLIKELAGGIISSDISDLYPKKIEDFQVQLNFENTNKLIGVNISKTVIKQILSSLEIKINSETETGLGLTIPAYRNDVLREADVIEEILRVYGYNNIKPAEKLNASIANTSKTEDYKLQNIIGNQLVGNGFFEILNNSLTSNAHHQINPNVLSENVVTMLNPLSNDLSVLRHNMLFLGLQTISHNINHKRSNLKFFEFGKTYHHNKNTYGEHKHLAIYITGNKTEQNWHNKALKSDFFYLKGVIKTVFNRLGINNINSNPLTTNDLLSEGLIYTLKSATLATFGVVNKTVLKPFSIEQPVLFADINWDTVLNTIQQQRILFKDIPKYPTVRRDFALLINNDVLYKDIYNIVINTEKKLLKNVELFDVYQGESLPQGKKSYAVSFTIRDDNKTLTDKHVDKIMAKLQTALKEQLGAELR